MDRTQLTSKHHAPVLDKRQFARISKLAYEHFGLDLPASKQDLVAARLAKAVRRLGLSSFSEYYEHVTQDHSGEALEEMVDDLTTNHTAFFRESQHFSLLQETILPEIQRKTITIWSAACSTGEEPYSIAISVAEAFAMQPVSRVRILASDISNRALMRAQLGVYAEERFNGLPMPLLRRYTLRQIRDHKKYYQVREELRQMVSFRRINLMKSFAQLPLFSVIFCRNVMIYFDRPTQQNLVTRLLSHLEPGGYLLIGHAENLNTLQHQLEYVAPATYRKAIGMRRHL